MKNITYQSDAIGNFYRSHRRRWIEFYPSERAVFEKLAAGKESFSEILDVGGAAGGLGEALMERFGTVKDYTSIDINRQVNEYGAALPSRLTGKRRFITADICNCGELAGKQFDLVTGLSVADWNVDAAGILSQCWSHVRENGHLVISLRLTDGQTLCDPACSYQHIWFEDSPPPPNSERAPYNVFNVDDALHWLGGQQPVPSWIYLYGYWGKPSASAHTPFDRLLFTVIAMKKPPIGNAPPLRIETDFPSDISIANR